MKFYYYLLIIAVCVIKTESFLSQVTYSPCSDFVVYKNDTGSLYGLIVFVANINQNSFRFSVTVNAINEIPIEDRGSVEFLEENKLIVNGTQQSLIKYKVDLSNLKGSPVITAVYFNGKQICLNPNVIEGKSFKLYNFKKKNASKKNTETREIFRRKKRDEYSSNPFLNGVIKQQPSDQYASNPFLSGHISVSNRNPIADVNPSNPWLQNVGGGDIYGSVPVPVTIATPPPTDPPATEPQPKTYPCGRSKVTNNQLIIRGENTRKAEWPWAVGVFRKKLGSLTFQCGGTLVSKEIVITAGHCVVTGTGDTLSPENVTVIIGLYDIQEWQTDDSKVKNIIEIILHPAFDLKNIKNDIALLRFQYVLTEYSDIYIAACLWPADIRPEYVYGRFGTIVGWGRDETGLFTTPTPRLTRQKVVTLEECQDSNPSLVPLTSTRTLCAGNRNGSGPCNGDSGSGMYFYVNGREAWILRAIVSTSITLPDAPYACNLNDYVVYTDISRFSSWIEYYL